MNRVGGRGAATRIPTVPYRNPKPPFALSLTLTTTVLLLAGLEGNNTRAAVKAQWTAEWAL